MKKCNTEIMKEIKTLEEKKAYWIGFEEDNSRTIYAFGEEPIPSSYNYQEVQNHINEIDARIRKLRFLLEYANVTTRIEEFDMTVAEALVYIAQLNAQLKRLNALASAQPLVRVGSCLIGRAEAPEYKKANYDVEVPKTEATEIREIIVKLQMAIDRCNLTNMIEC